MQDKFYFIGEFYKMASFATHFSGTWTCVHKMLKLFQNKVNLLQPNCTYI